MRNIDELKIKYYDELRNDVYNYEIMYDEQKIDYYNFYYLSNECKQRYLGKLDALFDVDIISIEEWKERFNDCSEFINAEQMRIRKAELEPSDPAEEG